MARRYASSHTRARRSGRMWLAALIAVVVLAGCGGSTSSSSVARTTPPGSVTGRDGGFSTVVPSGFTDRTSALAGGPINLLYAVLAPKAHGFRTNINVVREPSGGLTDPDTIVQRELAGLKSAARNAHQFSATRSMTVDGAAARAVDYLNAPTSGIVVHQYQVFALHGSWIYTITLTALRSAYTGAVPAMQQVLSGWRWT